MTEHSAAARSPIVPLRGRRAVISGGTTGIGRAIARLLAAEGAHVFICGHEQPALDEALNAIRALGKCDGMAIDLSDPENVGRFLDGANDAMGGYDIVIANAAVGAGGITQMDEPGLRHAISLNFTHYLLLTHQAARTLGDDGDIILIGSMSAYVLGRSSTVYAGIKAGIQGFSVALRRELGPRGIRVALVEPGATGSDMQLPDVPPQKQQQLIEDEKMLSADDIAAGVQYLLTQPRRAVIQRLTISPRMQGEE